MDQEKPNSTIRVGIVSPFPPHGIKHFYGSGLASYTKNLSFGLSRHIRTIIFADKQKHYPSLNVKGKLTIFRCWDKDLRFFFQLTKSILTKRTDIIHIQHEYLSFGGLFVGTLFPILLLLLKISSRKVIVTMHGVIGLDKKDVLGLLTGKSHFFLLQKLGLLIITKIIALFSNFFIVHNHYAKSSLVKNYHIKQEKIFVIPHGIENLGKMKSSIESKKKLALEKKKVLLFLGFIAPYKGLETLLTAFKIIYDQDSSYVLLIGGGEHPRLKANPEYQHYISMLKQNVRYMRDDAVRFVGFIPEGELQLYLSATDLVIVPHKAAIASSGPLSIAIGSGKLIVASNIQPFKEIIPIKEVFFLTDSPQDMIKKIKNIIEDSQLQLKIIETMQDIQQRFSWEKISRRTEKIYKMSLYKTNHKP